MGKGLPRSLGRTPAIDAPVKKMRLNVNESLSFTGATAAAVFATAVLSGLPEGNVQVLGAAANLTFTGPTSANLLDDFQGDYGLGTTPADDNTITAGDVDIIGSTAIPAATAEVSAGVRGVNATPAIFDNTDGSLEINLNVLLDADEVTNAETVAIAVTGTVDLIYTVLGDD